MKKVFFLFVTVWAFVGFSCNDYESAQEKLRKEKKAIEAFIDKSDIKVLKSYPTDGVFAENEYYRTSNGLYINVVDSGNGRRVEAFKDEVQVRFDYYLDIKSYMGNNTTGKYLGEYYDLPRQFIYGNTSSYSQDAYYLACDGWAIPLQHVGEKAIVNLIIPSSLAGSSASSAYTPLFYKNLRYTTFY